MKQLIDKNCFLINIDAINKIGIPPLETLREMKIDPKIFDVPLTDKSFVSLANLAHHSCFRGILAKRVFDLINAFLKKNPSAGTPVQIEINKDHFKILPNVEPFGGVVNYSDIIALNYFPYGIAPLFLLGVTKTKVQTQVISFKILFALDGLTGIIENTDFGEIYWKTLPNRIQIGIHRENWPLKENVDVLLQSNRISVQDALVYFMQPFLFHPAGAKRVQVSGQLINNFREKVKDTFERQTIPGFYYHQNEGYIELLDNARSQEMLNQIQSRLLGILKMEGKVDINRAAELTKLWPEFLKKTLTKLKDEKLVEGMFNETGNQFIVKSETNDFINALKQELDRWWKTGI